METISNQVLYGLLLMLGARLLHKFNSYLLVMSYLNGKKESKYRVTMIHVAWHIPFTKM